jgi:hypothetical protein
MPWFTLFISCPPLCFISYPFPIFPSSFKFFYPSFPLYYSALYYFLFLLSFNAHFVPTSLLPASSVGEPHSEITSQGSEGSKIKLFP